MKDRSGLTLIELIVVTAILLVAVVIFLFLPPWTHQGIREKARQASCLSNLKQIGQGVKLYVQDWDETYPPNRLATLPGGSACNRRTITWKTATLPYVRGRGIEIYRCPSNPHHGEGDETKGAEPAWPTFPISYAYNGSLFHTGTAEGIPQAACPDSARYILVVESNSPCASMGIRAVNNDWGLTSGFYVHPYSLARRMNVLYLDGHARAPRFSESLGTNNDNQQWTFLKERYADVNAARTALMNPEVAAYFE